MAGRPGAWQRSEISRQRSVLEDRGQNRERDPESLIWLNRG
jgi:hypothetical protein